MTYISLKSDTFLAFAHNKGLLETTGGPRRSNRCPLKRYWYPGGWKIGESRKWYMSRKRHVRFRSRSLVYHQLQRQIATKWGAAGQPRYSSSECFLAPEAPRSVYTCPRWLSQITPPKPSNSIPGILRVFEHRLCYACPRVFRLSRVTAYRQ